MFQKDGWIRMVNYMYFSYTVHSLQWPTLAVPDLEQETPRILTNQIAALDHVTCIVGAAWRGLSFSCSMLDWEVPCPQDDGTLLPQPEWLVLGTRDGDEQ